MLSCTFLVAGLFALHGAALRDIPDFGLGTWLSDRDEVATAVEYALTNGYNHVDAAAIYRNEDQTGRGIAASGIAREDLWVTSKLWNSDHRQEEAEAAIKKSLSQLGVDYLDLYLIHWPVAFLPGTATDLDKQTTIQDTWRTLEGFVRANLTRNIGLSNFAKAEVQAILDIATIRPYAHELETHPYLQQQEFLDWHEDVGIEVIAYSPLANTNPIYRKDVPSIFEDPFWTDLAAKKNVSVAQAVLAWGLQRKTSVIPKSTSQKHLDENLLAREITFTKDELKAIAAEDKKVRMSNPGKRWGVELFSDLDDPTRLDGDSLGEL